MGSVWLDNICCEFFWKFYVLFLAVLGLCCCVRAFSSWGEQGLLSRSIVQASHCGGFSYCRAPAFSTQASGVAAHGLSSCNSWALEHRLSSCGTQALAPWRVGSSWTRSNPCPLHWQVGSYPLYHQESPITVSSDAGGWLKWCWHPLLAPEGPETSIGTCNSNNWVGSLSKKLMPRGKGEPSKSKEGHKLDLIYENLNFIGRFEEFLVLLKNWKIREEHSIFSCEYVSIIFYFFSWVALL